MDQNEWRPVNGGVTPAVTFNQYLARTFGWMFAGLADKGAVRVDASGRAKQYYPLISRDDAVRQEAKNTLARVRTGGLGLLVSTMARDCELTDQEIDELYRILKEGRKKS